MRALNPAKSMEVNDSQKYKKWSPTLVTLPNPAKLNGSPFCLPCSAASNLFRIDNKLFYQKKNTEKVQPKGEGQARDGNWSWLSPVLFRH